MNEYCRNTSSKQMKQTKLIAKEYEVRVVCDLRKGNPDKRIKQCLKLKHLSNVHFQVDSVPF